MKQILYRKFDEYGNLKIEKMGSTEYTVRKAMEVLRRNGFNPMINDSRKLHRCWTNGKGINAYII